ncbi:MAG: 6-pyruvoyl trahydropterin synthase family protein [Halobacteriota archaeon]
MSERFPDDGRTGVYCVAVERSFIAQHYLTVPDPGPEGVPHSHRFTLQVRFEGDTLNEYGYLLDIDEIQAAIDGVESVYADELLNDLPAFEGLNPSVEHFSRIVCERVLDRTELSTPESICVTVWEDESAFAAYETTI